MAGGAMDARREETMFEKDLLKGRVVLITGGGTGLGRAMALRFAELGATPFLVARREAPLKETADAITARGGGAGYAMADVRDMAAVERAVDAAEAAFGRVDTLVNNAAGNFLARTETLTENGWNAVVGIVLNGTFHATLALGRRWIRRKEPGTVLSIATTYASSGSGSAYVVPSAAAKAGVLALTRSLAVEWARYRIRLNAIAPGPFPTEGAWSRLMAKDFEAQALARHPMHRYGRPEELADLAVYLISPQSEYVNGECVVIDGGQWLRGAGEFNDLIDLPDAAWEAMEAGRKAKAGSGDGR